jgi:hypothetical protein
MAKSTRKNRHLLYFLFVFHGVRNLVRKRMRTTEKAFTFPVFFKEKNHPVSVIFCGCNCFNSGASPSYRRDAQEMADIETASVIQVLTLNFFIIKIYRNTGNSRKLHLYFCQMPPSFIPQSRQSARLFIHPHPFIRKQVYSLLLVQGMG